MRESELIKAEKDYDREIDLACEKGDRKAAQRCFEAFIASRKRYLESEPATVKDVIARLDRLIREGCDEDPDSGLQPIRSTFVAVRGYLRMKGSVHQAASSLWRALQFAEMFDVGQDYQKLIFSCIKRLERPGLARN